MLTMRNTVLVLVNVGMKDDDCIWLITCSECKVHISSGW